MEGWEGSLLGAVVAPQAILWGCLDGQGLVTQPADTKWDCRTLEPLQDAPGRTEGGSYQAHSGWELAQPSESKILHTTNYSECRVSFLKTPTLSLH